MLIKEIVFKHRNIKKHWLTKFRSGQVLNFRKRTLCKLLQNVFLARKGSGKTLMIKKSLATPTRFHHKE